MIYLPIGLLLLAVQSSGRADAAAAGGNAAAAAAAAAAAWRVDDWSCEVQQKKWERSSDHPNDRAEMIRFAEAMAVQSWTGGTRNWVNASLSVCEWEGICCEPEGGLNRVTELHVERNGLSGAFPPTFTKMAKLKVVNVHLNNVSNFPPDISALTHLKEAKFGRNPICGTASRVLAGFAALTNLTKFNCNFCCLSGEFPDIFDNKPALEEAYWDGNNFTGRIPPSVTSLKSLTKLSFNLNSLSGPIPAALAELPLTDCRIGSDTAWQPYDTSPGSPERAWLMDWAGNSFNCPIPPQVLKSRCNAQGKGVTPSPINCNIVSKATDDEATHVQSPPPHPHETIMPHLLFRNTSDNNAGVAEAPPSIYWTSTPTLVNETLLISGAGLEGVRVSLCGHHSTGNCSELPNSAVSTWAHSIKLVLPTSCGPPCSVVITTPAGQATTVVANRPVIWWGASQWPLGPDSPIGSSIAPVIKAGGTLRMFGRALAWSEDGTCVSSATKPSPVATTTLMLKDAAGKATAIVPSHAASCYEAAFDLPIGLTGRLQAIVTTAWGSSLPIEVIVPALPPAPAPVPPTVIDVSKDCNGDLALAMRKAGAATHGAVVNLGAHHYSMTEPLLVPSHTTVQGQSPDASSIDFVMLPSTLRMEPMQAAVTVGSRVELSSFAISLSAQGPALPMPHNRSQPPGTVAVLMPNEASEFRATDVRVTTKGNASNAMRIEGAAFDVQHCVLWQQGCVLNDGFQPSTTLYMSNARDGKFSYNRILWSCSAFDLDTSERVIFEGNQLSLNVSGTIPHGNSVSGYGSGYGAGRPLNRWFSFLRNNFSRPPCTPSATGQCGGTNWEQRETWTTDNSHAAGVGYVVSQATKGKEAMVKMQWVAWSATPQPGTTLAVVNGSGMGQLRLIVGIIDNTTLQIENPFDRHLASDSFTVVVNTYDRKLLAGNTFSFTEVIQFFGVTLGGVIADNSIVDGNVNHSQHTRDPVAVKYGGSMRAVGECYHGPAPLFGLEYLGNRFLRADGIFFQDNQGPAYYQCGGEKGFLGPWIRWAVIRRNTLRGVSLAAKAHADPPACGAVTLTGVSTDIVAEHDIFHCDAGAIPGGYEGDTDKCEHCLFRP